MGTEYTLSGKIYHDCSKSKVYANTKLEVVQEGLGRWGEKFAVLATTTTGADGYFSLKFRASENDEILLEIPANESVQLYSPIKIVHFMSGATIDDGEVRSMINTDFYLFARTDVKVRLQCGRAYTNQDTLYITQPYNNNFIHKVVAPQSGFVLEFKGGDPRFKTKGTTYGIGWSEFKKASSGVYSPEYNFLRFEYPPCDKSPMEVVLNLP